MDPSDPLLEGLPDRVGASVARILAEAQQAARVLLDEAQAQPARQVAAAESRLRQLSEQADREQARRYQVRRQLAELRDALAVTTRQA
jgi:regulator of protease activity HflC (stomatin/prohibitin superfamily)